MKHRMTNRTVLQQEINSLPPHYYGEAADFAAYIKGKKIKKMFPLERAAEMAANEYCNDKELTAFSTLDGKDFLMRVC
jgi:hypothetical protein